MWVPKIWLRWQAERAGRRDGSGDSPVPGMQDKDVSQFEHRMTNMFETDIRAIEKAFGEEDAKYSTRYVQAKEEYERAKEPHERRRKKIKRDVIVHLGHWKYLLLMSIVILVEIPVNLVVFLGMFGEAMILTIILATGVSILVGLMAHLTGKNVRQHGPKLWLLAPTTLITALLGGIAYLRVMYFGHPDPEDLKYMPEALKHIEPLMLGIFYLVLNLVIYVIATWLAYEAHEADYNYHEQYKLMKKWEKEYVRLKERRDLNQRRWYSEAEEVVDLAQQVLYRYREINLAARANKAAPMVWSDLTKVMDVKNYRLNWREPEDKEPSNREGQRGSRDADDGEAK